MPRQPRQIVSREYYHIVNRGNNRKKIFYSPPHFHHYLSLLLKYAEKYKVAIYHYCLMSNHVHLLVRCAHDPQSISRFMHGLQTAYAFYFQKQHTVTGHVFENRFKNFHIDSDAYLLECGRYIERNPVRASIVSDCGEYPWSSYGYYASGNKNLLLHCNPLYHGMGISSTKRQEKYRDYVITERAYEQIVDQFFTAPIAR